MNTLPGCVCEMFASSLLIVVTCFGVPIAFNGYMLVRGKALLYCTGQVNMLF